MTPKVRSGPVVTLEAGARPRPVRDPRAARRGRHGRGVPRPRHEARARGGDQGAAASVATDAERLARFEREAQLLASLNHPHIASIYGFEVGRRDAFLVHRAGRGRDARRTASPRRRCRSTKRSRSRARSPRRSRRRTRRASSTAISSRRTSSSPATATRQGARLRPRQGAGSGEPARSPTRADADELADADRGGTQLGVILGTAAYMAPEQARGGRSTSAPTSGLSACVLYEMLTGKPAVRRRDGDRHARRRAQDRDRLERAARRRRRRRRRGVCSALPRARTAASGCTTSATRASSCNGSPPTQQAAQRARRPESPAAAGCACSRQWSRPPPRWHWRASSAGSLAKGDRAGERPVRRYTIGFRPRRVGVAGT